MFDKVKIFALGGLDENGKNCTVVEINQDIFVIDCGIEYPDKTMPGIDYVIPKDDYLKDNKSRVKAYFLSHGHDDQMGALAYIYKDVPAPIYGSKVTLSMLTTFAKHVNVDASGFDLHPVDPTSTFMVAGRKIVFFHTAHNIAESSGIAISTSQGNVVFTGDYVVENNANPNYLHDMNAIAKLAEEPTLALLSESVYASRSGYTAPKYRLTPIIEQDVKDAEGRVFISLFSQNLYNVDEIIALAVSCHKKVICYDEETLYIMQTMQSCGQLLIPRENYAPIEDINRLRASDTLVLVSGFGTRLYHKVALLAANQHEDKRFLLNPTDTYIMAAPGNDNTEIEATDALDELYRSGVKVISVSGKQFFRMHASEEDLKMMISILKPKYYIPVKGLYKDLLKNGQVALSMGINLSHSNVFLLEDGLSVILDETGGRIFDEKIPHGDLLIDGVGVGEVGKTVIEDREKLSEGVVLLALTVSKSKKRIVAGPDVQMRGFLFVKDTDAIMRDVSKIFVATVTEYLALPRYNIDEIKQNVYEKCLRAIRRQTGKEPMVLPLIIEVD